MRSRGGAGRPGPRMPLLRELAAGLTAGLALILLAAACSKQGEPFMPARPGQLDSTKVEGAEFGVWTRAKSPYYVIKPVVVPEGRTLEIRPGVIVIFTRIAQSFTVRGTLIADGKPDSLVTFRPNTGRGLPPRPGDWVSLEFEEGSVGRLDNTRLLYATNGIVAVDADLTLEKTVISNSLQDGIRLTRTSGHFTDVTIANNGQHGLVLDECDSGVNPVVLDHCSIGNNLYSGIWAVNSGLAATRCDIRNNGYQGADRFTGFAAGVHFEGLPGVGGPTFSRCNLDANLPVDLRNMMPAGVTVEADSNFWGYTTTSQMNALSNPDANRPDEPVKTNCTFNVPQIVDALDFAGAQATVYFCGWLDTPEPNFGGVFAPGHGVTPDGSAADTGGLP
jgi:hypothetical protein